MKIIVCVDDDFGMLFGNRRQSRDRYLIDDMLAMTAEKKLYITDFSSVLFEGRSGVDVVESFDACPKDAFCFFENVSPTAYIDVADEIILYKWCKKYPSDVKLDKSATSGFKLSQSYEFRGYSHDKILKELYRR